MEGVGVATAVGSLTDGGAGLVVDVALGGAQPANRIPAANRGVNRRVTGSR
jgi:hypothetical protein